MNECSICGAENEPEAESCQGCGFGLSFSRHTILEVAPAAAGALEVAGDSAAEGRARPEPETASPAAGPPGRVAALDQPVGAEVDELLRNLRDEDTYYLRLRALRKLGRLEASSPEIVEALLVARATGPDKQTRDAAARLLQAWPHREVLQQHPELVEAAAANLWSPLGRLELPDWATRARRREKWSEPEADAEPLAEEVWEEGEVAVVESEEGPDRPVETTPTPEDAGEEAPAAETWAAAEEHDAAEETEQVPGEIPASDPFWPLDWDLTRLSGTMTLAWGLYLVALRTIVGTIILARGSSAPGTNAAMSGVFLEWSLGLILAFMGVKKLQGRWDTRPPGFDFDITQPVGSLGGWLIFLLVWGLLSAVPYLAIVAGPFYVLMDIVRLISWLFG